MSSKFIKAPADSSASAFFIALCLLSVKLSAAPLPCVLEGEAELLRWQSVSDGDTLTLEDGRRLRIIGINTPEMARGARAGEPLAQEARAALLAKLPADRKILVQVGREPLDRYQRLLAHVYLPDSRTSIADSLLDSGLAYRIAVPPNLRQHHCYGLWEARARARGDGLWQLPVPAKTAASGFQLRRARLTQLTKGRSSWWLETDQDFVIQLRSSDLEHFDSAGLGDLIGQRVEIRGWMVDRAGSDAVARGYERWVMPLRHPAAMAVTASQ